MTTRPHFAADIYAQKAAGRPLRRLTMMQNLFDLRRRSMPSRAGASDASEFRFLRRPGTEAYSA